MEAFHGFLFVVFDIRQTVYSSGRFGNAHGVHIGPGWEGVTAHSIGSSFVLRAPVRLYLATALHLQIF